MMSSYLELDHSISTTPLKTALPRSFRSAASRPLDLLGQCPIYAPTQLTSKAKLAAELDIAKLFVKDESSRMRLGSFKALGGVFAIAQLIRESCGHNDLESEQARAQADQMTFVTASAGNHGLSVSSGARLFGAKAVVLLPRNAPKAFEMRLVKSGAEVVRGGSYEECVAEAMQLSEENDWVHLADGSWPGYTERPALIMEGYTVLAEECRVKFEEDGSWPNHVFLQAGVGGMAAAFAAHVRDCWVVQPRIVIVEPEAAPCLKKSVEAGMLTRVEGPESEMGRLDCKDASLIAFESLRHDADDFILISDEEARLAAEHFEVHGILTTSSGAAGLAGVIKSQPGRESSCLVIVSEGKV